MKKLNEQKERKKLEDEKRRKLEEDEHRRKSEEENESKNIQEAERQTSLREYNQRRDNDKEAQRLAALKRLTEENGRRLEVLEEDSQSSFENESIRRIKLASQKLRRTSAAVDEIEKDLQYLPDESLRNTENKIKQLETSIASLDIELERFQIEKMKARTQKVRQRMSLIETDTNGFN